MFYILVHGIVLENSRLFIFKYFCSLMIDTYIVFGKIHQNPNFGRIRSNILIVGFQLFYISEYFHSSIYIKELLRSYHKNRQYFIVSVRKIKRKAA